MKRAVQLGIWGLLCVAPAVWAQDESAESVTRNVAQKAWEYGQAVSCMDMEGSEQISPDLIAALRPYRGADDYDDAEYLAFWAGDVGCAGGSGTTGYNAAYVIRGPRGQYYVDPSRSSPLASFEFNTRFLERIVSATHDTLVVEYLDFDEDDSNCCPSLQYRATLKRDKQGNWVQAKRQALGKLTAE